MEWAQITDVLASLVALTFLEVVLGVDNLVFISIACSRLPVKQQKTARRVGLFLAMISRLVLLASVVWLIKFTQPMFTIMNNDFSARDIFLICGGLFLLYKSTQEIHMEFEGEDVTVKKKLASFTMVVTQIAVLDIIFSIDSVFTAIGMTQKFWVMACAIIIAIILMIFASEPLTRFVIRRPTIKMLALSFLLLIGTILIADGFNFHVPRGYIYFALAFSVLVEALNLFLAKKHKRRRV